jgi:hypothetical protein
MEGERRLEQESGDILLEGEVMIKSRSLIRAFDVVEAAAGGSYHTRVALAGRVTS